MPAGKPVYWRASHGTLSARFVRISFTGQALPSMGLFQSPLVVCEHADRWGSRCEVPDGG